MKIKLLFFIIVLVNSNFFGQTSDSTAVKKVHFAYKKLLIPSTLIVSGLALKNTETNKKLQKDIQKILGPDFETKVEDFFQFAPIVQIYGGRFLGFTPKNNFKQQTINILLANLISTTIVKSAKHSFLVTRPDNTDNYSFPSGHTATAFTNASLLFYEYKDSNIWYASSGFMFASATGFLRIANNKHYTSDVLAGAGIGIGVGLAVSYWSPFKSFTVGKNKTHAIVYPKVGENYGIGMLIRN